MGAYTTNAISDADYKRMIDTLRTGYIHNGKKHRPNNQIADILVLEANLGCRLGDIVKLTKDSIIRDGDMWKLNIREEKTNKPRTFIVPDAVYKFIDGLTDNNQLFTVSKSAVWKALREVTAYLNLDKTSSHSIRKMAGNKIYEATGYDIEATARFLNHSSVNTTRRYIRRSDKQMEDAITKIVSIA